MKCHEMLSRQPFSGHLQQSSLAFRPRSNIRALISNSNELHKKVLRPASRAVTCFCGCGTSSEAMLAVLMMRP